MTLDLNRARVLRAFTMMAHQLASQNVRGEILLAGGAVMARQYDVDRVTRDVDGLVTKNHGAVMKAARLVAGQLDLPRGWLNEGVSVYLSTVDDKNHVPVFDHRHLAVHAVSTEHMLALKARAARVQDLEDLQVLIDKLELTSANQVFQIVEQLFPDDPLSKRSIAVIEDLFETLA